MSTESAPRSALGGLIATAGATSLAYLGPLVGLPMIDLAACFAAAFDGTVIEGSRQWWAGLLLHFGIGTLVLPAAFVFGVRRVLALERGASGLFFGFVLYLAFSALLLPLAGQGVFGARSPDPLLVNLAAMAGGLLYGVVLARISVREQMLPPLPRHLEERTAA